MGGNFSLRWEVAGDMISVGRRLLGWLLDSLTVQRARCQRGRSSRDRQRGQGPPSDQGWVGGLGWREGHRACLGRADRVSGTLWGIGCVGCMHAAQTSACSTVRLALLLHLDIITADGSANRRHNLWVAPTIELVIHQVHLSRRISKYTPSSRRENQQAK